MNLISVLSCLSLLLAASVAQGPKPCHAPALLNGGFTVMSYEGFISTGTVSYDAFGQRMRVRSYGLSGNVSAGIDQLMLFNQKVYYEINWSELSCKKRRLSDEFVPMHVPADAQLMGQVFMGSSSSWGMGVLTNTWYGYMEDGMYTSVFTEIGCIPVAYSHYTAATGWITVSTFNWVYGNSNPMDFHPPFICAKAELEETDKADHMFTIVESLAKQTKKVE